MRYKPIRNVAFTHSNVRAVALPNGIDAVGGDVCQIDCQQRAPIVAGAFHPSYVQHLQFLISAIFRWLVQLRWWTARPTNGDVERPGNDPGAHLDRNPVQLS